MASNSKKNGNRTYLKYNLKIYIGFLLKYKLLFIFLLFIILLTEATYVLDKFLFKVLVDKGTIFADKTLPSNDFIEILAILAAVFLLITLSRAAFRWLQVHLINILESDMILEVKKKFFNHIINLSYNFHTSHKTGSLITKLIRGSNAVERMGDVIFFNLAPLIFQLFVVGASLMYFDSISAIIIIVIVVTFISYDFAINRLQQKSNLMSNEADDNEKASISDIFTNIESIKYFGKESNIKNRYARLIEITRAATLRHWNYFKWLELGQSLVLGIGTFFLLYFSIRRFLYGELTLGVLVFIYTTYVGLYSPLFGFVYGVRNFYRSMADFDSLFQYAKIQNEVKDLPDSKELKIRHGTIEFKNVSFSYKNRKILSNFNLKIPKGKKVALVGTSGAGKSTIIKLLYRLYDLDKGDILIDGRNIKSFKQESLRSELSIVPQECILFDDTIYNNVIFSKHDSSKEEVLRAMKFAQLDKTTSKFPLKEKTIVGERGVRLSGGEKQRVSIARAILADKKILILDEATSSLDSETEHEIKNDLEKLMEGRTSIIIAHRISTIINADLIVVLSEGKISQIGMHKDLINKQGIYSKLWNLQKGGYIK